MSFGIVYEVQLDSEQRRGYKAVLAAHFLMQCFKILLQICTLQYHCPCSQVIHFQKTLFLVQERHSFAFYEFYLQHIFTVFSGGASLFSSSSFSLLLHKIPFYHYCITVITSLCSLNMLRVCSWNLLYTSLSDFHLAMNLVWHSFPFFFLGT